MVRNPLVHREWVSDLVLALDPRGDLVQVADLLRVADQQPRKGDLAGVVEVELVGPDVPEPSGNARVPHDLGDAATDDVELDVHFLDEPLRVRHEPVKHLLDAVVQGHVPGKVGHRLPGNAVVRVCPRIGYQLVKLRRDRLPAVIDPAVDTLPELVQFDAALQKVAGAIGSERLVEIEADGDDFAFRRFFTTREPSL